MNTDQLIERLVHEVEPVRRLRAPWTRAALWLLGAGLYLGVLTALMTSRADVAANGGGLFLFQQIAALITGIVAAAAAFASVVPGYPRRILRLPAAAAFVWLAGIAAGALQEPNQMAMAALADQREWLCVGMIVFGGVLPAAAIAIMLRRGMPVAPRVTAMLGVLAVAGLANVGACLSHPHPSSIATLTWHGTTVLTLLALGGWAGRAAFRWSPAVP